MWGGSRNPLLMARLAALLPGTESPPPMPLALVAMTWKHWLSLACLADAGGITRKSAFRHWRSQETVLGAIFPANP